MLLVKEKAVILSLSLSTELVLCVQRENNIVTGQTKKSSQLQNIPQWAEQRNLLLKIKSRKKQGNG